MSKAVEARVFRPVANRSWTKSLVQTSFTWEAAQRYSLSFALTQCLGALFGGADPTRCKFVRSLHVYLPAFAAKKNVDAAIALADARLADLAVAAFDPGMLAVRGFEVLGRCVHF